MNRSGKILTGLLIALAGSGVILGPGYLGYCWFFSGSAAGEYPITVGKPLELELSPEMNPIRFNSVVEYLKRQTISTRRTDYRATLKEGNRELWTTTFSVTHSSDRDKERHRGTGVGIGLRSTVTSHSSIRMFSDVPLDDTAGASQNTVEFLGIRPIGSVVDKLALSVSQIPKV